MKIVTGTAAPLESGNVMMAALMSVPLLLRQVIPPVTARTATGKIIRAWDYKHKHPLVIAFLHSDCSRCEAWLEQLAAASGDLTEREAVAMVIYSETPPRRTETLPPPLVAATDAAGHSHRAFLGKEVFGPMGLNRLGVFVTDRYGDLFEQWLGRDAQELPANTEILDVLGVIQIIC